MCKFSSGIVLSILFIYPFQVVFSQSGTVINNIIPPSPNSSALLEYANTPVSYYTGVPDISVPLYTLTGRNISVPIGVSYHASGIKVQDIASSVGLGWSLNAGGAITRVVRGIPDGHKFNCGTDTTNTNYWSYFLNGLCDHQSDIYYYNFLGKTGKFVLDEDGNAYTLPYTPVKIYPGATPSPIPLGGGLPGQTVTPWMWVFTDDDGTQYYFGEDSSSREISTTWKWSESSNNYVEGPSFISTWYLTKVVSSKGVTQVTFSYSGENTTSYEIYSSIRKNLVISSGSCSLSSHQWDYNNNIKVQVANKYLSLISTDLGSIFFDFQSGRSDLTGGRYLNSIIIKDKNNITNSSFTFEYAYFTGLNSKCDYVFPSGYVPCDSRLKLLNIKNEQKIKIREFVYNDSVDLPQRNSPYIDHWGFYNYNSSNYPETSEAYHTSIPYLDFSDNSTIVNGSSKAGLTIYSGARKNPDYIKAQANILTQVNFPTGVSTYYSYEGNITENGNGGGIRIKSISDKDNNGNVLNKRTYIYSQGRRFRDPVYHYITRNVDDSRFGCFSDPFGIVTYCSGSCSLTYLVRHSSSLNDMFDVDGVNVGYGLVTEYLLDNSMIERYFSNFEPVSGDDDINTRADIDPAIITKVGSYNSYYTPVSIPVDKYGPPFSPKTTFFWERGLLIREKIYDNSNTPRLISESGYEYDFNCSNEKIINNKNFESSTQGGPSYNSLPNNLVRIGEYKIFIKPINILSFYSKIYGQTSDAGIYSSVTTTTSIVKHPFYQNYTQSETVSLSDGAQIKTEYRYPRDVTGTWRPSPSSETRVLAYWNLYQQNSLRAPVEVIRYYKKPGPTEVFKVIAAELNTYQIHSVTLRPVPFETYELQVSTPLTDFLPAKLSISGQVSVLNKDVRYRLVNQYGFDSNCNLTSQTSSSGISASYDWDSSTKAMVTASYLNPNTSLQMKTEYTNQPLVGITSIKDPNLQTTNFEYNQFEQLKLIRDQDNNITNRYRYHYNNQSELSVDFTITGVPEVGVPVSYTSSLDQESIGANVYIWDFGDGQILQNAPKSVNHAYSNAGTFTVKLSKVNPEYGSMTVTKQLTIYAAPSVSINSSALSVDLCSGNPPPTLTATPSGGCPGTYTYNWYYKLSTNPSWISFGWNTSTVTFDAEFGTVGVYDVKCVISDFCGVSSSDSNSNSITFYKSNPNCPTN